jgi:CAAX protease family protein
VTPHVLPFANALAVYAVLVAPWLAYRKIGRMRADDHPPDKTALYRRTIGAQVAMTAAVAALWLFGGIPAASMGVRIPQAWSVNIAVGAFIVSYFAFTAIRARRKAHELRERMRARGGQLLLPETRSELRYFAVVCAGSGVAEELLYRGFLMFLVAYYAPHLTIVVVALIVSAVFGLGHAYQGWRGVMSTGLTGLILAILYVASGSILLPAVIHSAGNLQAIVILWPPSTGRVALAFLE